MLQGHQKTNVLNIKLNSVYAFNAGFIFGHHIVSNKMGLYEIK